MIALSVVVAAVLGGCSDDDEPSAAETCNAACQPAVQDCVGTITTAADCSTVCQVGYSVVPRCGDHYSNVLGCVGGRAFVQCTSESVTVSVAVTACADELGGYLGCVAEDLVPACLAVPLGDAQCTAAGLPPHAFACAGESLAGCQLFEGTVREGGVGTFCCP